MEIPLDDFSRRSWRKAIYKKADWNTIRNIQDDIMKVYERDEVDFRGVFKTMTCLL